MFPWRRRWYRDDPFRDFDEEFRKMEEDITRMFDEIRRISLREPEKAGPYVYGFSMRMGPEGKPKIEEFGNIPGMVSGKIETLGEREPLADIIEGDKEISVVVELPGVEKKDINLNIDLNSLEVDVDTRDRKYHKKLYLPCEVRPEKAKATFKNGILEVKVERVTERKEKGIKIQVE